jgi:3-oxoacyl-[acyl-carrier protein] reductase
MDLKLAGKVAIVTGSSKGLGRASALALAQEGCAVVICARGGESLAAAARDIGAATGCPDRIAAVEADLTTQAGVDAIVAAAVERFGGVDILVNNIGIGKGAGLLETPDATWHEAFDGTLFPAIRASKQCIPLMRARGGGAIVLITSIWGRESGGRMVYNAVKAAENSLAKAMAQQFAQDNIRVNAVAPGSILFEGGSWWKRQQDDPQGIAAFIRSDLPFGRFGSAEEVGDVVAFLCSPRASWISGACLTVDGCQSRSNL